MAVVTLDAGHGGYDNGASYQGRREKEDNLNLALAVGNILQNRGVDVRYTRTEDVYQTPQRKAAIANENGSDLFVSFHRNSSPSPNQYSGVQTLVYADSGPRRLLAQNINNELEKVGFTNLGISVRKDLPVIRESDMPAGLVEVGFINTERDNALLDAKFPEVAQAIADGILQTLQETGKDVRATEEAGSYTIETGMFAHEDNAKDLAALLQEDGFECFIDKKGGYYVVCQGMYPSLTEVRRAERTLYESGYETRIAPIMEEKS